MKDQSRRLRSLCAHHYPGLCGAVTRRGFVKEMAAAACITDTEAVVEGAEDDPHKVARFHVLQIYGDHAEKLRGDCQLPGIEAVHSWDPRVSFDFDPSCT